jgi:Fe-S-cluster containining protein
MRYFWLNFHVNYACRNSGACCSAGWPIPIERERAERVNRLRPDATSWLVPVSGAPEDVAGTLAIADNGHCVFHHHNACAIHSDKPSSCTHFPFVCLIDQRGVHVTLSHYCPTAAAMLFDHQGPVQIVEGPPPIAGVEVPEGLDARDSLPPLESPTLLMSFDQFSRWEAETVERVSHGSPPAFPGARSSFDVARAAVAAPLSWPAAPDDLDSTWNEHVAPAWPSFAGVIGRYLAAKVFASWANYLGDGTEGVLRQKEIAEAVLIVEAARQCSLANPAGAGRERPPLDAAMLKEAIRQSDLLLVHYADSRVLSSANK